MIDISAVGSSVTIKTGGDSIVITQFSEEGTPFEAGDVDVSTNAKNLNGTMISSRTPSVYPVSVTVIPGSDDDHELQRLLKKASIMPGGVTAISKLKIDSLTISVPAINESNVAGASRKYTWTNGRIKSGPTGPSTSGEGRMSARTYNFEFEKYIDVSGSGMNESSMVL